FGRGVFDELIEGNGGSTNGYTTRDYTAYLNNIPREALPIVLDLESDRMANLAITKENLEQERGIVMEERRLRIDDEVWGVMDEALYLQAFVESAYRWNVIGFMSDIQHITLDQARAYFQTYYAPNNATLVLAGDVEPQDAFRLVERDFGAIPRRRPPLPVDATEPPQDRPKRTAAALEERIDAVVEGLQAKRVPDDELAKAKTQLRAEYVEGLKTVSGKANKLGFFETVFGDYRALFGLEDAWRAVTADDVQRVARTYLVPTHRTVVVLEPVPAPGRPAASRAPRPAGVS